MQIYAWDKSQRLIHSCKALKHTDYQCIECNSPVRLRKGIHRHPHFYHLSTTRSCRLNGKSMEHLQVQYYLQKLLPEGECFLEYRFPEISRIADVLWRTQKIVFEVQCSPIDAIEVAKRNEDYRRLGLQVIWILHTENFDKSWLCGAEIYLQGAHFYYSNINADGNGVIYDRHEIFSKGLRTLLSEKFSVNLNKSIVVKDVPKALKMNHRLICFEGDRVDRVLKNIDDVDIYLCEIEVKTPLLSLVLGKMLFPFRIAFQMMLERACK